MFPCLDSYCIELHTVPITYKLSRSVYSISVSKMARSDARACVRKRLVNSRRVHTIFLRLIASCFVGWNLSWLDFLFLLEKRTAETPERGAAVAHAATFNTICLTNPFLFYYIKYRWLQFSILETSKSRRNLWRSCILFWWCLRNHWATSTSDAWEDTCCHAVAMVHRRWFTKQVKKLNPHVLLLLAYFSVLIQTLGCF